MFLKKNQLKKSNCVKLPDVYVYLGAECAQESPGRTELLGALCVRLWYDYGVTKGW